MTFIYQCKECGMQNELQAQDLDKDIHIESEVLIGAECEYCACENAFFIETLWE